MRRVMGGEQTQEADGCKLLNSQAPMPVLFWPHADEGTQFDQNMLNISMGKQEISWSSDITRVPQLLCES